MELDSFLREVVVLLASAVVVVTASVRLRVPPIAALLVTGILIGPQGLALISRHEDVELFAEVGVALLLFAIGLEVSIERLASLRRAFLLGGGLQVGLTTAVVAASAVVLDVAWPRAVFLGWVVALSSTALVLRTLSARRETEAPHGQLALAILLFQDFLIVPMISLTPLMAGTPGFSTGGFLASSAVALVVLAGAFVLTRRLVPLLLNTLEGSGVREVLLLGSLALCLGMGWLTHSLGFSLALGSFLAGVVMSGSHYSHQVVADVAPFRDLFSGVFFISIGMLLDLEWVAARPVSVLLTAGAVVLLKILTAGVAALALRFPARTITLLALSLAQIGEFSFVLMEVGMANGVLAEDTFQLLLAAAVLTLLATPLVVAASRPVAERVGALFGGDVGAEGDDAESLRDHVVIVGYGEGGSLVARVLREAGIRYVVVDLSGAIVRAARVQDESILYGDATRREILEHAGVERANVVVFAISDPRDLHAGVRVARELAPAAQILVRTRRMRDIEGLRAAGADQVVAEEFETTIEVFTRVLQRYHVPRNVIRAQTRVLRGEGYRMLRSPRQEGGVSQAVIDALAAGTTDLYLLDSESGAAGQSLRELDLRRRSGATVIAVVRDGSSQLNPEPDLSLEAGDCLVLMGSHVEIDSAFDVLARVGEQPAIPE